MTLLEFIATALGAPLLVKACEWFINSRRQKKSEDISIVLSEKDELREVRHDLREKVEQLEKFKEQVTQEILKRDTKILQLEFEIKLLNLQLKSKKDSPAN